LVAHSDSFGDDSEGTLCHAEILRSGRNPTFKENSPTLVGAQVLRHQLRVETRSMDCLARVAFGCVINYGLKSVAWFSFGCAINIHATGFSQWLMTKFMSAEFIQR